MELFEFIQKTKLSDEVRNLLENAKSVVVATNIKELEELSCGEKNRKSMTVSYPLPDGCVIDEVDVVRVKNGISANYREPYMRRRDPECMLIADDKLSDKTRYEERFTSSFSGMRDQTLKWLKNQKLAVFAFEMGPPGMVDHALAICPVNASFFAFGLALLQGIVDMNTIEESFDPSMIIYVAPSFRHSHLNGKQIVVHNRSDVHEIFSYNLYPGPSAKKGVYGALIELGEKEGWVTAHCSAVQVVTPYDNIITFMHEGASGGGKSEMLQQPHRLSDGRLLFGENIVSGKKRYLEIPRTCDLYPVCDDMGLCHPALQENDGKLYVIDAESGWFIRVDHIQHYGTDPDLESMTIHAKEPMLFLNIDAVSGGHALIWEHIEDQPGKKCPNPRVVIPRKLVPNVVDGKVAVDIRSFGVRTPPCTAEKPSYGIIGLCHILPPALAWLWRLVAPRGYANPSIVGNDDMVSEGVGSYWPFSTGKKVVQANLLLKQFIEAYKTRYVLIPNQHIGAWKTGFMSEWMVRDYLARRGNARFRPEQVQPSRCPLLGYTLDTMRIEGVVIPKGFLQVNKQEEVGNAAYDEGAKMLTDFFHGELRKYLQDDLDPLGREIIECCLNGGSVTDYLKFMKPTSFKN